jgi:hypothetical protein
MLMAGSDSLLWTSTTHADAESAIRALHGSGIDIRRLSILGKGYHSEEQALGFYHVGARMRAWGGMGAFWGAFWGLLLAPAVFVLPGIGVVAMAGPVVAALFSALEGAATVGGVAALAAALTSIGIPRDEVIRYAVSLKADGYALLMHGDVAEVAAARRVLENSRLEADGRGHPRRLSGQRLHVLQTT